jgi:beta-galactosidase
MVPQAGLATRTWREVVALGATLGELPALPAGGGGGIGGTGGTGPVGSGARVAIVFDWESWWAVSSPDHPVQLDWQALVQRWYAALHRQNVAVDFVRPTDELSPYALVLLPHTYLLTDAAAGSLTSFVRRGGRLLVTPFSDLVDEHDAFRDGGFQVGLREVLGVAVDDFGALVPPIAAAGQTSAGESAGTAAGGGQPGQEHAEVSAPFGPFRGEYVAEELQLLADDVVVEARFSSGRTAGLPALTTRASGTGAAHYLATIPDDEGMLAVTRWAAAEAGIDPVLEVPNEWVEVARRGDVLTVINHGAETVSVPLDGVDLVTGAAVHSLELGQYDWALVRPTEERR